ncbi:hypothetical protein [Chryseobacterium jejuense]|uniref:hypothetical protein n=1 Tax=Chryseobacterium jejuense TaxID=445960 RepID=UPI001AE3A561|nr:hypothetical protein [Chryseobacterium jejuense]MBP2615342.1 hypothetical protein [Chryseobacterium jejuense]
MKKIILLSLLYCPSMGAQNLYCTMSSYSNNVIYDDMRKLNNISGAEMSSKYLFSSGSSNIGSASFDSSSNMIFTLNSGLNILGKYNVLNDTFSTLQLPWPANNGGVYVDIAMANGRLFAIKESSSNIISICEFDKLTGNLVSEYNYTTPSLNGFSDFAFCQETNELVLLVNSKIVKYNIVTGSETSFSLPSGSYDSIVPVNQKLYVTKQNTVSGNIVFTIESYQLSTGSLMSSSVLSNTFTEVDEGIRNLCFLGATNELVGTISSQNEIKLLKFNISTFAESLTHLFWGPSYFLGDMVATTSMATLSTNENLNNGKNKKIKNAYDMAGKKISPDTKNQIIIFEYEDGSHHKVFQK